MIKRIKSHEFMIIAELHKQGHIDLTSPRPYTNEYRYDGCLIAVHNWESKPYFRIDNALLSICLAENNLNECPGTISLDYSGTLTIEGTLKNQYTTTLTSGAGINYHQDDDEITLSYQLSEDHTIIYYDVIIRKDTPIFMIAKNGLDIVPHEDNDYPMHFDEFSEESCPTNTHDYDDYLFESLQTDMEQLTKSNEKLHQRWKNGRLLSFAWPGGYPILYTTENNSLLCPDCATESMEELPPGDIARPSNHFINYEYVLTCDECNGPQVGAYVDEEEGT